jgi:hypothetical protein
MAQNMVKDLLVPPSSQQEGWVFIGRAPMLSQYTIEKFVNGYYLLFDHFGTSDGQFHDLLGL